MTRRNFSATIRQYVVSETTSENDNGSNISGLKVIQR